MLFRSKSGLKNHVENRKAKFRGNIIMISGCRDDQTSADAWINRDWAGAMTASFLETMKKLNNQTTCQNLLNGMRDYLKTKNYKQVPQICCARKIDTNTVFCSSDSMDRESYLQCNRTPAEN